MNLQEERGKLALELIAKGMQTINIAERFGKTVRYVNDCIYRYRQTLERTEK